MIEDVVINATAKQIEYMATRQISQEITDDSSEEELASAKAVYNAVKNASEGGGTGGGCIAPLIVTMAEDGSKASHNFKEISSHALAGGDVFFDTFVGYIALNDLSYEEGVAIFTKVSNYSVNAYIVGTEGDLEIRNSRWATADQIGDISSALDELHTYAQGLINGGATE